MPRKIFQSVSFPGVVSAAAASYTCSHGISPGRIILTTFPQRASPKEFGDVIFSDGSNTVPIRDCKVESVSVDETGVMTIDLLDRRWRWQNSNGVSGVYNQKDERGKLVPWSIRSPYEIAQLLLKEMGERNYTVVLPPGLPRAIGENVERYLRTGENFPQSATNPELILDFTPPAAALARFCEQFGCRIIFQPVRNRVLIASLGKGVPFPSYPFEAIAPSIAKQVSPQFVGVYGAPIKYQSRFLLEAVGEEWDGTYLPINQLSYSPVMKKDQVQISLVRYLGAVPTVLAVTVAFDDPAAGTPVSVTEFDSDPAHTVAQRFTTVAGKLQARAPVAANFIIATTATTMTFTGKTPFAFTLDASKNPDGSDTCFGTENVQLSRRARENTWAYCPPPTFTGVQATDRLSYGEAQSLARKSVFKCYRILIRDPHDKGQLDKVGRPYKLPGTGVIKRRQQVILTDTKVAQVLPRPRIPGAENKVAAPKGAPGAGAFIPNQGALPDFYNGFSRSQPNTVTGSILGRIGYVNWFVPPGGDRAQMNTSPLDRVYVGFHVVPKEQMIVFDDHVFAHRAEAGSFARVEIPMLTLEAGYLLLDAVNNQLVRWTEVLPLGGAYGIEWQNRDDVEVGVILHYDEKGDNKVIDLEYADVVDAKSRAGHYLRGMAAQYQIVGGEVRRYIGIIPHDPDGYAQQVTWSVGTGADTILSGNTEHHPAIPPYPARRRFENLPANKAAAVANRAEAEMWDKALAKVTH